MEHIITQIEEFLDGGRIESETESYPEVNGRDLLQLYNLIYAIIREKWSTDMDGALPVTIELINHTDHWPVLVRVPHEPTLGQLSNVISRLQIMMGMVVRMLPEWDDNRPIHE